MLGLTNAQSAVSAEADKVWAQNFTGKEIAAGDKAILTTRARESAGVAQVTTEGTASYQYPVMFYEPNIIVDAGDRTPVYFIEKNDAGWNATSMGIGITDWPVLAKFEGFVFAFKQNGFGSNSVSMAFVTPSPVALAREIKYIGGGYALGVDADIDKISVYTYNIAENTVGDKLLITDFKGYGGVSSGWYADNVIFIYSYNENKGIFYNTDDFSVKASQDFTDYVYFRYFTGLTPGDYAIASSKLTKVTNNYPAGSMVLYKLNEAYQWEIVTDGILSQFFSVDCDTLYDNDAEVLTVCTEGNVFGFTFDKVEKNFNSVALNVELPTESTYYKASLSADLTTLCVKCLNKAWIYELNAEGMGAYAMERRNFYPDLSVTGIATGNKDEAGQYEFEAVGLK